MVITPLALPLPRELLCKYDGSGGKSGGRGSDFLSTEGWRDEGGGGGADGRSGSEEEDDGEQAGREVDVIGSNIEEGDKEEDGLEDRRDEDEDDGGGMPAAPVVEAKKADDDDEEGSDGEVPSPEAVHAFVFRCPVAPSVVNGWGWDWTGKEVNRAGRRRRSRA